MILDEIINHKKNEIAESKKKKPLAAVRAEAEANFDIRDFTEALSSGDEISLISEIKKASPSAGLIREDFDPRRIAAIYAEAGASAMSILIDEHFFQGSAECLKTARSEVSLPALYKEFVIDEYQIYEARSIGADAVLLIVRALGIEQMAGLQNLIRELGMAALVEAHNFDEMEKALKIGANIIGINNRDLDTFKTEISTCLKIKAEIPAGYITVAESGIRTRDDVLALERAGFDSMLIGESLMRSENIFDKISELLWKTGKDKE
jgi:indole-3-glycerol phosphate synthase